MEWRVLISGKKDPFMNMALDESIYHHVSNDKALPTIRFYDWEPASFSCGFNQDISTELDFDLLEKSDYGFVRRPTGGRMVLHEDEVTYAVISSFKEEMNGNILSTYLRIGEALVAGLRELGVDVELSKGDISVHEQKQPANPCFTSPSRFELTYKRKKVVGSAQTRNNRAFLQHGSILRTLDQRRVADFMPLKSDDDRLRMASLLERRTISLQKILQRSLSFEEAVEKILAGFELAWSDDIFHIENSPSDEEISYASKLADNKYSTNEWNKNREKQKKSLTYI